MAKYRFVVNGQERETECDGERPLLEVLREDFGLTGTKYGCGEGQCRACTVMIDGRAAVSCVTPVRTVAGRRVVTIEGLAAEGRLTAVQEAFVEEGAMQCGYCTPGMVMRTTALLGERPRPGRAEIVEALNGSLCRCNGYPRIVAAVERAARKGGAR